MSLCNLQLRKRLAQSLVVLLSWIGLGSLPAVNGNAVQPDSNHPSKARATYGKLVTLGDRGIIVNGNTVRSGATILSGTQIETPSDVSASLQLWPLGRLEIAPRTSLLLSYAANQITVTLSQGCAVLTTYSGVTGTLTLPQGIVKQTGPEVNDFVDVCVGSAGAAPLIDEGAAVRAGAGTCWAGAGSAVTATSSGFNPLYLLGAAPLVVAGIRSGGDGDGRPPVASVSGL